MWFMGVPFLIFLMLMSTGANNPQSSEKYRDRHAIDYCLSQLSNPSIANNPIAIGTCEKLKSDFRSKYNTEP